MNKIILIGLVLCSGVVMGQSKVPDTTLVNQNNQRIGDLKSKIQQATKTIDETQSKEVDNQELMALLLRMDANINRIANRQDSIIQVMRTAQEEEAERNKLALLNDSYYLIIESHLSDERAEVALRNHSKVFENAMVIMDRSERWYYVVLRDAIASENIQTELAKVRIKVPTAWYVKGSDLKR